MQRVFCQSSYFLEYTRDHRTTGRGQTLGGRGGERGLKPLSGAELPRLDAAAHVTEGHARARGQGTYLVLRGSRDGRSDDDASWRLQGRERVWEERERVSEEERARAQARARARLGGDKGGGGD